MAGSISDMKPSDIIHNENEIMGAIDFESPELIARGISLIESERNDKLWKASKVHWRALLTCVLSFTGGTLFGYDVVVNGASIAMPSFFLYFGDFGPNGPFLPAVWTSLWVAMSALLQTVGAFATGFMSDRWGRKYLGIAAGSLSMVATGIQYSATSRGALLAGKMVSGFAFGVTISLATSYISEVAPANIQRPVQSAFVLSTVFFQGVALGIIRYFVPNIAESAFRTVIAIQWSVGGLMIIAFLFAPESPTFLVTKGRINAAQKIVTRIYGVKNDPDSRLACIIKTIHDEQERKKNNGQSATYLECFQGTNLKRTLAVMLLFSSPNLAGAAFLAQSIYFLVIAGLPAIHAFDVGLGGFALACLFIIGSWFISGKVSNRTGVYVGVMSNLVIMLIIGCLHYAPGIGPLWAIAVLMSLLASILIGTLSGMGTPIAAELSQLRLRAKTISLGVIAQTFTTWLTTFVMPYIYSADAGGLLARTGFIFFGTSFFILAAVWYLVPDTTGMNAKDLDYAYEQKIPAWRMNKAAVAQHASTVTQEKIDA